MLSRFITRFSVIVQASTCLGRHSAFATSSFLESFPLSTIENTRISRLSNGNPLKDQIIDKVDTSLQNEKIQKESGFRDCKLAVELIYTQNDYQFCIKGTISNLFLSPEQVKVLFNTLKNMQPEQLNKWDYHEKAGALVLDKSDHDELRIRKMGGHTIIQIEAIPALITSLTAAIDNYNTFLAPLSTNSSCSAIEPPSIESVRSSVQSYRTSQDTQIVNERVDRSLQNRQIIYNKEFRFARRNMAVQLTSTKNNDYEFFIKGTVSYIFLNPEQAEDLLDALKNVKPEQLNKEDYYEEVGTLILDKSDYGGIRISIKSRFTAVKIEAIPSLIAVLASAVREYKSFTAINVRAEGPLKRRRD